MTRQRKVKRILSFSSGVRNTLETACAALLWAMMAPGGTALLLDLSACGDDRLAGLRADLESAHRNRQGHLAVRQHLRRTLSPHESRGTQRVGRDLARELRELVEANDVRRLA